MSDIKKAMQQFYIFSIGNFIINLAMAALIVGVGFVPIVNILWSISLPFWGMFFTYLGVAALLARLGGVHGVREAHQIRRVFEDALKGK